ncbi:MAG: FG-GAP-like repeat-containing protein [bacterium]|nr:FG-GAP-like repeat-containing protein [bacterium]
MKKTLIVSAVLTALCAGAHGQTYFEHVQDGWGFAMQSCRPALGDLDGNGRMDMLVGTADGNLVHLEQTQAGAETFVLKSEDFCGISIGEFTAPCLSDLDRDGLADLIVGSEGRVLRHYEQSEHGSLLFGTKADSFLTDPNLGMLTPTMTDFGGDGILDLIVGTDEGVLRYYRQDAAGSTGFSLVSSMFGSTDFGFRTAPSLIDLDSDGLLDLIVGENGGHFLHYRQNAEGDTSFIRVTERFCGIFLGYMAGAAFTDLDGDGRIDMITANSHGRLGRYEQDPTDPLSFRAVNADLLGNIDVDSWAAPAAADLDRDGLIDLCVGMDKGRIWRFEQQAAGSVLLSPEEERWNGWDVGNFARPAFTDLDGDGLIDLIIGEMSGRLIRAEQDGAGSAVFDIVSEKLDGLALPQYASPCVTDLDHDGLLELLVGGESGTLQHFEQDAPRDTSFTRRSGSFNGIDAGRRAAPVLTDIEHDGLLDLVIGNREGTLLQFEQAAPNDTVFIPVTGPFSEIKVRGASAPVFTDLDGNGLEDLIVGDSNGGLHFFGRSLDGGIEDRPRGGLNPSSLRLYPNFPNPFNPSTLIRYDLLVPGDVTVSVFDGLGRAVRTARFVSRPAGPHDFRWDGKNDQGSPVPAGVYTCLVEAAGCRRAVRLVLLK